jgi:hypothetical protein
MALPPFTAKTALTYLLGVAAVLFSIYLLATMLMHAKPHQSIEPTGNGQSLPQ